MSILARMIKQRGDSNASSKQERTIAQTKVPKENKIATRISQT